MPNFVIPFKISDENDLSGEVILNSQETIIQTQDSSFTQTELKKTGNSMDGFTGIKKAKQADITSQHYIEAFEPTESASQPKESTITIPKKVKKPKFKAEKSRKRKSHNEKKKPLNKHQVGVVKIKENKRKNSKKIKSKPSTSKMTKKIVSKEMNDDTIDSPILNFNNNENEVRDTLPSSQQTMYSKDFKKITLSQPGRKLSQKEKLLWLQNRREVGIWVECCNLDCKKWRFLVNVFDPLQVPDKWYCQMNPDTSANSCNLKEWVLKVEEEEDLIHATYSAGSLVWAHITGYPWWPAIVDDCPDTEQFYWLNGFSDIPTFYNVTFFDEKGVTRSWLATSEIYPYVRSGVKTPSRSLNVPKDLRRRLATATKQADAAMLLGLAERLKKYSFITRYKGAINYPMCKMLIKHITSNQDDSSDSESRDIQMSDNDDENQLETKRAKVTLDIKNKHQYKETNSLNRPNESRSSTVTPVTPSIKVTDKNIEAENKSIEPDVNRNELNQEASNGAYSTTYSHSTAVDTINIDGFLFTEDSIVPSTQTDLEEINFENSPTYSNDRGSPDFEM